MKRRYHHGLHGITSSPRGPRVSGFALGDLPALTPVNLAIGAGAAWLILKLLK